MEELEYCGDCGENVPNLKNCGYCPKCCVHGGNVEGCFEGRKLATNEELGQELDRWQLIARDLIIELSGGVVDLTGQPDWVKSVWFELSLMDEMRISND